MKRLGENQTILMEKLKSEGKIENIGKYYRTLVSRRTSNAGLKNFVKYCVDELGYKIQLGKRGGLETATLYVKEKNK